jgi:hypothetical protein
VFPWQPNASKVSETAWQITVKLFVGSFLP